MSNSLKCSRLDFSIIAPYIKRGFITMVIMGFIFNLINKSASLCSGMIGVYGVILISYPFIFEERYKLQYFYGLLPINRNSIVSGRYIMMAEISIMVMIVDFFVSFISGILFDIPMNEIILSMFVAFFIYLIMSIIELPVYFKLGYSKAKMAITFIFICLVVLMLAAEEAIKKNVKASVCYNYLLTRIAQNKMLSIIAILIIVMLVYISYILSKRFYKDSLEK